jgi:uncharacterized membrane protein YcaP (DUF421 family)
MYGALMVLFKIAGRRSLAKLTTFDFLLLMIIGEATQQALLGDDFSLINSMFVIVTLIAIDVGFSLLKQRSSWVSRLIDGEPTIIVENGKLLHQRLRHARLVEADIMETVRSSQGIELGHRPDCLSGGRFDHLGCCRASRHQRGANVTGTQ